MKSYFEIKTFVLQFEIFNLKYFPPCVSFYVKMQVNTPHVPRQRVSINKNGAVLEKGVNELRRIIESKKEEEKYTEMKYSMCKYKIDLNTINEFHQEAKNAKLKSFEIQQR